MNRKWNVEHRMSYSWLDLVRLVGWEFARPDTNRTLAFVYAARISLSVEEWCAKVNPDLSLGDLAYALTKEPDWLGRRKDWLKTEWPQHKVTAKEQLDLFGLTAAKALLAVGSRIPDGTADEMTKAMELTFPQISAKTQTDEDKYEAWNAHVIVDTHGEMNWGYGGPLARAGKFLPVSDTNIGDRSDFQVFLQNQMRIAIQQRIEEISAC